MTTRDFLHVVRVLMLLACFAMLSACPVQVEDPPFEGEVTLNASPPMLLLTAETSTRTCYLSLNPARSTTWRITDVPWWLQISPDHGNIRSDIVEISISMLPVAMDENMRAATIEIIGATGGVVQIEVRYEPAPAYQVDVLRTSLDFGLSVSGTVGLKNHSDSVVRFAPATDIPWLEISGGSNRALQPGQEQFVALSVDRDGLIPGIYKGELVITLDDSITEVVHKVEISMAVSGNPSWEIEVERNTFLLGDDEVAIQLTNDGNVAILWTAESQDGNISLMPSGGEVSPGNSIEVVAVLDRNEITRFDISTQLYFSSAGLETILDFNIEQVQREISIHQLDFDVVDAEYSRAHDRIALITGTGSRFIALDPKSGAFEAINLTRPPLCVSVSLDGTRAVIGHDALVSIVDLNNVVLEDEMPIATQVADVLIAPNNYVYALPAGTRSENLYSLDLATGLATQPGGYARRLSSVKLHPSGEYIYGVDISGSQYDLRKFDIRSGVATSLYSSAYTRAFPPGIELWIPEDGNRMYTATGNTFRLSTVQEQDMTYSGRLDATTYVYSVDQSSVAERTALIMADSIGYGHEPLPEVWLHDSTSLNLVEMIPLLPYSLPEAQDDESTYEILGRFVYFNSAGTEIHVLGSTDEEAGLLFNWFVQSMPVELE